MNTQNKNWLLRHSLFIGIAALLLIAVSVFKLDQLIFETFKHPDHMYIRHYSREVTNIGLSGHYFLLSLVLLGLCQWGFPGMAYFNERQPLILQIRQWSIFMIRTLLILGIPLNLLKAVVGRQRPLEAEAFQNLMFRPFTFEQHYHSFPSGHTQVLFTVATICLLIWPRFKYVFLLFAALFSFTRSPIEQHWLSDVFAGALLGYLGTLWLHHYWPPKISQKTNQPING